ncbi:MAG: hypothetical protein RMJ87_13600 [Cytophagales bacterium]|nr:hypothetical protein [Bernardetiaceae bacterium]MDW8206057.1 hypothetical protein [Cytophagales bacterium]
METKRYSFALRMLALALFIFCQSFTMQAQELLDIAITGESWETIKANQEGRIIFLYYKQRPFNYLDEYARQTGIDYDLADIFIKFLKRKYGVNVEPVWIELTNYSELASSFPGVKNGAIGFPAVSALPEMNNIAVLTPAYMHNKLVVVTHPSIRKAASEPALKAALKEATAFYIPQTAAGNKLQQINLAQKTIAVANSEILADTLAHTENSYAVMPLYDYFVAIKRGLDLNRQDFMETPQADVSWWLPKTSDWNEPVSAFFNDANFEANASFLVKRHCSIDAEELTLKNEELATPSANESEKPLGMFEFKATNSHIWFALITIAIVAILIIANRSIAASRKKAAEELSMRKKAMK